MHRISEVIRMYVCENLEPKQVFRFFEEICAIPHGSGNTKAISDYCVSFAKERSLRYLQDETNNVIIFKDGTEGYEHSDPVILQGHMDMVCEKESDCAMDFKKDGLSLYIDGDYLKARGTTLGGDDGIAIAYAFALLDSSDIAHPPLEVVLTVDEETGMEGAKAIDVSMLKGRKLLNIDSDDEGIFLAGCAGGLRADCVIPVSRREADGVRFELTLHGLKGGHSGGEIHKERANAIAVSGRVLKGLLENVDFKLCDLKGGMMDNAIPREASAVLLVEKEQVQALKEACKNWDVILKREYRVSDSDITLTLKEMGQGNGAALDAASLTKILFFLRNMPVGIQHMSMDIEGLVETSLNPGILKLHEDAFQLSFSVRSNVTSRKYEVTDRLTFLTEFLGGELTTHGDYPAWEYKAESDMRTLIADCYRELFSEEPKLQVIHAGLECGILSGKLEGLDCVSFGPNNRDIHTPKERLSISSTERVWRLLVEFLRRSK